MNSIIDLKEVRKQLKHGSVVLIAQKAGVNVGTVSRALSGDKRSPKLPDILKATAEILAEYKAKELEAMEAINEVMNPATPEQITARLTRGENVSPLL